MDTKKKRRTVAEAMGLSSFEGTRTIVYDATLKRPGCVIIQAALGATIPHSALTNMTEHWLVAPTPDMKLYEITSEQFKKLEAITRRFNAGKKHG